MEEFKTKVLALTWPGDWVFEEVAGGRKPIFQAYLKRNGIVVWKIWFDQSLWYVNRFNNLNVLKGKGSTLEWACKDFVELNPLTRIGD